MKLIATWIVVAGVSAQADALAHPVKVCMTRPLSSQIGFGAKWRRRYWPKLECDLSGTGPAIALPIQT